MGQIIYISKLLLSKFEDEFLSYCEKKIKLLIWKCDRQHGHKRKLLIFDCFSHISILLLFAIKNVIQKKSEEKIPQKIAYAKLPKGYSHIPNSHLSNRWNFAHNIYLSTTNRHINFKPKEKKPFFQLTPFC